MAMGSFAQGFRFAITLILNMTLQKLGGEILSTFGFGCADVQLSPHGQMIGMRFAMDIVPK